MILAFTRNANALQIFIVNIPLVSLGQSIYENTAFSLSFLSSFLFLTKVDISHPSQTKIVNPLVVLPKANAKKKIRTLINKEMELEGRVGLGLSKLCDLYVGGMFGEEVYLKIFIMFPIVSFKVSSFVSIDYIHSSSSRYTHLVYFLACFFPDNLVLM